MLTLFYLQGGAGATIGAARIIGALQPKGPEVHFIVASCENMVAGHGLRPGDVLQSANGMSANVMSAKSIETGLPLLR
jgi:leucyl aminopeptidase